MRELVIIENKQEKQIAYVEDGILKEFYKEKDDKKRLEGNIYAGKVAQVLPGMQAAFIDIGEEKNTFLHNIYLYRLYYWFTKLLFVLSFIWVVLSTTHILFCINYLRHDICYSLDLKVKPGLL